MGLAYTKLNEILLNENNSSLIFKDNFNACLRKLLANDLNLTPDNDILPDIWKCSWYNGMYNGCGYPKGAAVWLNTENEDEFVTHNMEEISAVVTAHPLLSFMLQQCEDNPLKRSVLFKKVANGTISYAPNQEPLYYLGDITQPIQVRISLSANNTALPDDDDYWCDMFNYDIFDENLEKLSNMVDEHISAAIRRHMEDYHLDYHNISSDAPSMGKLRGILADSVECDLSSNLDTVDLQKYKSHRLTKFNTSGLDFVEKFEIIRDSVDANCLKWYRYWKSGRLEQGGIVRDGDGLGEDSHDSYITIKLPYRYDYPVSGTKKFYELEDATGKLDNNCLFNDNRYSIFTTLVLPYNRTPYSQLTQDASGTFYFSNEVKNVKNDGFQLRCSPGSTAGHPIYYSFSVSGFVKSNNFETLRNI